MWKQSWFEACLQINEVSMQSLQEFKLEVSWQAR